MQHDHIKIRTADGYVFVPRQPAPDPRAFENAKRLLRHHGIEPETVYPSTPRSRRQ